MLPIYQVDAFTDTLFRGNPAAVVLLPGPAWPEATLLQAIAAENNLSETAFVLPAGPDGAYPLRWLTPVCEVDLCGHATLAAAFVHFQVTQPEASEVRYASRSGPLTVARGGDELRLDFPALPAAPVDPPADLIAGLGAAPLETGLATDYLALLESETAVRSLEPDLGALARLRTRGVIVTAPGERCDFVSRFFAPAAGIAEDPVTGSAHCTLAPYWSRRLGKTMLEARQISPRGGAVRCEDAGERVRLWGRAVLYLEGRIRVPASA
jgi:PhzF family phenazine biosynthesis protein